MELSDLALQNFFLWALFGIIIGFTAHIRDNEKVSGGAVASSIFGSIGGIAGGFFASFLSGRAIYGLQLQDLSVAIACAIIITLFYRSAFRMRSYIKIDQSTLKGPMTYAH